MVYGLYVIFDKVAQEASIPFDAKNDDVAKRRFEDTINRQIRPIKTVSVSDYDLVKIAEFDSEICKLSFASDDCTGLTICNGEDVKIWTEQEMADLMKSSPTFSMDEMRKQLQEVAPSIKRKRGFFGFKK